MSKQVADLNAELNIDALNVDKVTKKLFGELLNHLNWYTPKIKSCAPEIVRLDGGDS